MWFAVMVGVLKGLMDDIVVVTIPYYTLLHIPRPVLNWLPWTWVSSTVLTVLTVLLDLSTHHHSSVTHMALYVRRYVDPLIPA